MSPRQNIASLADTSDSGEGSKTRGLAAGARNSRRSNSAMSNARTRGSASKDESESDQQQGAADSSVTIKDETIVNEPEEEEEDNGASGDSNNGVTQSSTRGRRKPGGKRRRGGGAAAAASSRTRQSRAVAPSTGSTGEAVDEEPAVKSEVDEDAAEENDAGDARPDAEEAGDDSKLGHQRSASGLKELAGLGLKTLGDGEGEPLVPRRTRRGAVSPNEGGQSQKDNNEEDEDESQEDGTNAEDVKVPQSHQQASENEALDAQEEDETAEEGVTRCLCGSADENVGLMIQCETCKCWQHCICMGMRTEEDCPDVYFCEQCRPELHVPLLRLLGVLPTSRNGKKIGSKTQSGRVSAKDAAKELKEAKEAVLSLAKENEKRRKEGREPVTGWSIAQEQEHQHMLAQEQLLQQQGGGTHRRQISESRARTSRSQSGDDMTAPKSPPKRRSTMNSRDSAYGWESIPAELLNDDEGGASRETSEVGGRKRSRGGQGEDGERQSPSPVGPSSSDGSTKKRRRMSSNVDATEDGARQEAAEDDEEGADETAPSHSQTTTKKTARGRATREQDSKPKHPNQYTARRAAAAAAAAAAAGGTGVSGSSSPSPSPHKARLGEGSRRTTLREAVSYDSQNATTMTPNGSQNETTKSSHPGTSWGMPDHLSHLAYLLPTPNGPEPLRVNLASTKGMPSASKDKSGHQSNAIKDKETDRIIQASPQPFQMLSLVEPNTKIKFPGKRTTMGEMKKRVRNILEFVSRLQIESVERERRMKFLGIVKESNELQASSSAVDPKEDQVMQNDQRVATSDAELNEPAATSNATIVESEAAPSDGPEKDTDMKDVDAVEISAGEQKLGDTKDESLPVLAQPSSSQTLSPSNMVEAGEVATTESKVDSTPQLKRFTELNSTSMALVDELTRDLLSFQHRYGTGTSGSNTAMASSGSAF